MGPLRQLLIVRFHRRPQKLVTDSAIKGLLKCGAIFRPIMLVTMEAGPSMANPKKVYSATAAHQHRC